MWRAGMERQHSLLFYRRLHTKRECALRLRRATDMRATKQVTRLRANVHPLAATTAHTHHRDHGGRLCASGAVPTLRYRRGRRPVALPVAVSSTPGRTVLYALI